MHGGQPLKMKATRTKRQEYLQADFATALDVPKRLKKEGRAMRRVLKRLHSKEGRLDDKKAIRSDDEENAR